MTDTDRELAKAREELVPRLPEVADIIKDQEAHDADSRRGR